MSQIELIKAGVLLVGGFILVSFDQWSKVVMADWSARGLQVGIIKFVAYQNQGIAFSIPLLPAVGLVLISGLLILLAWLFLISRRLWGYHLGLLLAIGGGMSNLWDKLHFGWVRDFVSISQLPIFNLADIFIFVGVVLIIISVSYDKRSQKTQVYS